MWNVGMNICLLFVRRRSTVKIVSDTVRSWSACWLLCLSPSGALWCRFTHLPCVSEAWMKVTVYLKVNKCRPAHAPTQQLGC